MSSEPRPPPYSIFHRPAAGGPETPWLEVATARHAGGVADELASWQGPRLHHGDIVRVLRAGGPWRLHVFDADRSRLSRVTAPRWPYGPWLDYWEGPLADGVSMLSLCDRSIGVPRLVLAACACLRASLAVVVAELPRVATELAGWERHGPGEVVDVLESWATGGAGRVDLAALGRSAQESVEASHARGGRRALPEDRRQAVGQIAIESLLSAASFAVAAASDERQHQSFGSSANTSSQAAAYAMTLREQSTRDDNHPGNEYASADSRATAGRLLAPEVRRFVPVSAAICASMGLRSPLGRPRREDLVRR